MNAFLRLFVVPSIPLILVYRRQVLRKRDGGGEGIPDKIYKRTAL